jgi:hypothetical protein
MVPYRGFSSLDPARCNESQVGAVSLDGQRRSILFGHIDSYEERNSTFRVSVTQASLGRSDRTRRSNDPTESGSLPLGRTEELANWCRACMSRRIVNQSMVCVGSGPFTNYYS